MKSSRDPSPLSNESKESNKENQKPHENEIPLSFSPPPPRNKKYNAPREDLSMLFEGDDVFMRRSPNDDKGRYRYDDRRYESPGRREYGYDEYRSYKPATQSMSLSAELEQETANESGFYFDRKRSSPRESSPSRGRYRPPKDYYSQSYPPPNSPYDRQRRDYYQDYPYPPQSSNRPPNYYNYPPPANMWPENDFDNPDKEKPLTTPRKRSHEEPTKRPPSPKQSEEDKSRKIAETLLQVSSPYRSPAKPAYSSTKKPKRSPLNIETPNKDYFSFAMDVETPKDHHMPFSPMGPAFPNSFDALPLPNANSLSSDDTPLPVDNRYNEKTTPFLRRRSPQPSTGSTAPTQSPFSAIMGGCFDEIQSPFPERMPYYDDFQRGLSTPPKGRRQDDPYRETPLFKASPVSTHPRNPASGLHSARDRFRKLQGAPRSSSPYRMQIGSKKEMPRREPLASSHRHNTFPSPPPPTHQRYMGYEYDNHQPPTFSSSSRGGHYKYGTPFTADTTPGMAPSSTSSYYSSGPQYGYYNYMKPHHSVVLTPNRNKENETPSSTAKKTSRRAPCNCKRSKCLKLYCECFAAEQYCDGCNCHDCSNIPAYESARLEAIKTTRAKNPNAFKPRFKPKPAPTFSPSNSVGGHNMGCRCKKSACLKKYCECFEAGVMCGDKCKCVDCLNFIGSQALIDRRRKIKDHRGAELAMKSADEAWKSGRVGDTRRRATPSSAIIQRSSSNPYRTFPTPSFPPRKIPQTPSFKPTTPKQPIRLPFTPQTSKANRKIKPGDTEPTFPIFGPNNPQQNKTTTLAILSFLSNDDLYNACLVNKKWSSLSLDEELWQFS